MTREPTPTIRRRQLGDQLTDLRERANITLRDAAGEIDVSQSNMSRIENGKLDTVKVAYVKVLLAMYDATDAERAEVLELAEQASRPEWFVQLASTSPVWFRQYLGYESAASKLRIYGVELIDGLLQTEAYARVIALVNQQDTSRRDVDSYVALRRARQERMFGDRTTALHYVLNEAALRRTVGGPDVMREQLRRVAELAELEHITVQVLPFAAGAHPAMTSPFTFLDFDLPGMTTVYLENGRGAVYLDGPNDLDRYRWMFDQLTSLALDPDESRRMLARVASDL